MNADNITIVLVEPSHPGNIGAVARAMKNMGLSQLTLIAPERFPDEEATWRAVWAADVLENARIVGSLDEALADAQLVVGATARDQRIPWPVLDARAAAADIAHHSLAGRVAVVFGREDNGLSNEELMRCNLHLAIPTSDEYSSLNLAMAVQVVCYELLMCKAAAELPLNTVTPLLFGCVVYWAVGLNPLPGRFFKFLVILLLTAFSALGLGMVRPKKREAKSRTARPQAPAPTPLFLLRKVF